MGLGVIDVNSKCLSQTSIRSLENGLTFFPCGCTMEGRHVLVALFLVGFVALVEIAAKLALL
jgi:hypothetical protein